MNIYYVDIIKMNALDAALDREERNSDSRFIIENSDFEKYHDIVREELAELSCVFEGPRFHQKIYPGILTSCLNQPALQSVEKLRNLYLQSGMHVDEFVNTIIDSDIYTACVPIRESRRFDNAKSEMKALITSNEEPNRIDTGRLMGVRRMMQILLVENLGKMYSDFQTLNCIVNSKGNNFDASVAHYGNSSRLKRIDAINSLYNIRCFLKAFRRFRVNQMQSNQVTENDSETQEVRTINPQPNPRKPELVPAA